ncbi:MAG: valine--tRNA ligase [Rhodospirillaceae bacterium]|jgi:valyl-tRNA synthetase|nr:valine--tRNA ligase [Rhodospirillaceae bacterium]MBT7267724.1 valine--tRNA ligase [Rhodospirillaceae bacterium]
MLEKSYQPDAVEAKHYKAWEESGAFKCGVNAEGKPYTIVIPPPNVTGSLHMGHALNNTLQDILTRYHRMKGDDALWQPGCDHAGIATQMVVERQLAEDGKTRHDLGRANFIDTVWKWKEESGGTIVGQLRRLGASCDWSRERFTMDDGLSQAVRKVFVDLYKQDLIYRDKRLVNWDPKLHTAISDLEVEQRETVGNMWYFKYPIEGQAGEKQQFITVGTTRPETMLGDTAVAVHPDDERYTDLVGKNVILPICNRPIPIVADEYSDPEKGSGAVKITPAHDFNDFEVGKRNDLEMINIFDLNADLNENVPEAYQGMERFAAREKVIAELDALGLLEKIEDNEMTVPYGDRSGVVVEPWLTDQWFVDAKTLAGPAIKAVEDGRTKFVPQHWENTYFEWMRNIQPWCVSRQIWWGHQIPAWFGPDGAYFVELTEEEAQAAANKHYGKPTEITRDEDVLDTWFSSALWPFSTLGWPEETPELGRYYPTDVLVTGFDIIFFWVARMMMMGLHFLDEVPFHEVYIHALVRDENGQKMSKSKGNVIDPLHLIDTYGADALRMTLAAHAAQGRDIKLSESRVEGYRNFTTKLWNAARFCEMNGCEVDPNYDPKNCTETINKWIVGKVSETTANIAAGIDDYKFNEAAGSAYQFTWGTFCDWYIELAKPIFYGDDSTAKAETQATAAWVLDQLMVLLHPFMPFITEELWEQMGGTRNSMLINAAWPELGDLSDSGAEAEMDWVVRLITQVRSVRAELNVSDAAKVPLILKNAEDIAISCVETHGELIKRLARLEDLEVSDAEVPEGAAQAILDTTTLVIPLSGVVDVSEEKARLEKEIAKLDSEIERIDKKLANENFTSKAPAEVVEEEKVKRTDYESSRVKVEEALERLSHL